MNETTPGVTLFLDLLSTFVNLEFAMTVVRVQDQSGGGRSMRSRSRQSGHAVAENDEPSVHAEHTQLEVCFQTKHLCKIFYLERSVTRGARHEVA